MKPAYLAALLSITVPLAVAATSDEVVTWIRSAAIPLNTVSAGSGFSDMYPVKQMIGDARLVALGEATHGTREFSQLKHRMVEFLASEMGFNVLAIEANMPEAYRLNDFVLKGEGDPRALLKGMYFWTWDTEEVLDTVLWMREFNRSGRGKIEFTGFDMQSPAVAMETVRAFVKEQDGNWLPTLDQQWREVAHLRPGAQAAPPFGLATARFPLAAATGKHVVFSGFIKTQAVTQGYAGLWWRVDGEPGAAPLVFDNMQDRGPKGTTPWSRYEISLDVPADATNINFGVLHPGNGAAWFDSLQVSVDGRPYTDKSLFDLDFESPGARGFYTGGNGYQVAVDAGEANTGHQSLRIRAVSLSGRAASEGMPAEVVAASCKAVLSHLENNRATYIHARPREVDWVTQNARLVLQFAQAASGEKSRDQSMAENVQWIAGTSPRTKVIVWAHNGHAAYGGYPGLDSMGGYLRKAFDGRTPASSMINFGFAFNEGAFRAVDEAEGRSLREFTVGPAARDSLDRTLASAGYPIMALDLRQAPKDGPVSDWFNQFHAMRTIGAVYSEGAAAHALFEMRAREAFDALLFVSKTTAARANKR